LKLKENHNFWNYYSKFDSAFELMIVLLTLMTLCLRLRLFC